MELRDRFRPLAPDGRTEFQKQRSFGIRVALWLIVPLLALGGYYGGHEWGLVIVLCGLIIVPAITLPLSIAHTYLLRFLGYRGPIISTATGALLGVVLTLLIRNADYLKPLAIYGGVYGLIISLGNTVLAAPDLIADRSPRTLEEQAKADGL